MNLDEIKELITIFNDGDVVKLKITKDDFSLNLEKACCHPVTQVAPMAMAPQVIQQSAPSTVPSESGQSPGAQASGDVLLSPMVGTFYRCAAPETPPYVNIGDKVRKGQTIAIIEAMKIMNEIEAEYDCKVIDIVPDDGQPVEYNSKLFIVEKL